VDVDSVAQRLRRPFLDWIGQLASDELSWWTSRVAERNTLLDSLFHKLCYLELAEEHRDAFLVAESRALAGLPAAHSDLLRWGAVWARHLVRGFGEWLAARLTRRPLRIDGRPAALLHSCLDEGFFKTGTDRYFPGLDAELERRGFQVLTLPWFYNVRRPYLAALRWLRARGAVIAEDYYRPADYFWAARSVMRQRKALPGAHTFQGHGVTHLVREACWEQSFNTGAARFLRYALLPARWKAAGFRFELFVDRFENLLTEKPMVAALRREMPGVHCVGFQHYVAPYPLWLSAFTSPGEAALAPWPHTIVCNSQWTRDLLSEAGFPADRLVVGPSLRYPHLLQPVPPASPEFVLVLLGLELGPNLELCALVREAFPGADVPLRVKPHPMMPESYWEQLPVGLQRVEGPPADFLPQAICAVVSASTSALEIALAGVPVVTVASETDLTMDALAWFPELPSPVRRASDLRDAVVECLESDAPRSRFQSFAQEWRAQLVTPVTPEAWSSFLPPQSLRS
jgi:hypothetical protein